MVHKKLVRNILLADLVLSLLVGLFFLARLMAQEKENDAPAVLEAKGPVTRTLELEGELAGRSLMAFADPGEGKLLVEVKLGQVELPAEARARVRVFFNLPEADATTPTESPHYLGNFTFFPPDGAEGQSFVFDLDKVLGKLGREKRQQLLATDPELTAVLVPVVDGEDLSGARVELLELKIRVAPNDS